MYSNDLESKLYIAHINVLGRILLYMTLCGMFVLLILESKFMAGWLTLSIISVTCLLICKIYKWVRVLLITRSRRRYGVNILSLIKQLNSGEVDGR